MTMPSSRRPTVAEWVTAIETSQQALRSQQRWLMWGLLIVAARPIIETMVGIGLVWFR